MRRNRSRYGNAVAFLGSALLACLAWGGTGCGTRMIREPIYEAQGRAHVEAYLRRYREGGEVVARGFQHPAIIAPVRLAHMLAFVDAETGEADDRETRPAVPPDLIYEVGDALSRALEAARPDDEVVVRAVRSERRLGIFSQHFLTSFLAWVEHDQLHLKFGHADWEVPKFGPGRDEELPEPEEGESQMRFRVLPGDAFVTLGPRSVAFDWRDERFREPERVELTPTGEIRRRTILLQSPPGSEPDAGEAAEPAPAREELPADGLAPATLRRLADLEEARRRGEITEGEYQARRRALLEADPGTP